jgi:hypothetical protein
MVKYYKTVNKIQDQLEIFMLDAGTNEIGTNFTLFFFYPTASTKAGTDDVF